MQWLLRRIKAKMPFDANKLYASELLSILLQQTPENKLLLGDIDGIDVLLQQLAVKFLKQLQIYILRWNISNYLQILSKYYPNIIKILFHFKILFNY